MNLVAALQGAGIDTTICDSMVDGGGAPVGVPIPDGYLDGGRGMQIHSSARATSGREIIIVDRAIDERLRGCIAFARSPAVMKLAPRARAQRLQRHIHWVMGRRRGRKTPLRNCSAYASS